MTLKPRGTDVAPWVERLARVGYVAKALLYITIGLVAAGAAFGPGRKTTDTQGALRVVHGMMFGRVVLLVVAAGLMGYAVWRVVEAVMDPALGWVVGLSRFGIAARGVVFCLIGFFLARAASQQDAGEVGGVRESLRVLASIGRWPFVVVALGLIAYGMYELVNARYRRIRVV